MSLEALPPAVAPPQPSPGDRRSWGRAQRSRLPRGALAAWAAPPGRRDPVEVLIDDNRGRDQSLVPLRYRRMLASPFAFLRGSALVMSLDLAATESCGIDVQLCGDAHVANFGIFASPERQLLFDLNDFDETWPGPFEWDLKRLVTSAHVAARSAGMRRREARTAAVSAARSYREAMQHYASLTHLEVWYARLNAHDLVALVDPADRHLARATLEKAAARTHQRALAKLTTTESGVPRIVADPPLVSRVDDPELAADLPAMIDGYRLSLAQDRRALFDHYRLVDYARKVVGVGSVGTHCWVLLLIGPAGGPLVLQAKQAGPPAPQVAGLPGIAGHQGMRVVHGQQRLQAASDILLGWTTAPTSGNEYYVRQMWDAKGAPDLTAMRPAALATYAGACGWALARAHARTGASAAIAGYLGRGPRADDALADFAAAYGAQTEADHTALVEAAADGRIEVASEG